MNTLGKFFISILITLSIIKAVSAQKNHITVPDHINFEVSDSLEQSIFNSLELMFKDMKLKGQSNLIDSHGEEITYNLLNSVASVEYYNPVLFKQIINAYKVGENEYLIKIELATKKWTIR